MKILRARGPGKLDQVYDKKGLRQLDEKQHRRRICGAEVEAMISFATASCLIDENIDKLARLAQETGLATQMKRIRTMADNAARQLGSGVSAEQMITIVNNVNDVSVVISATPAPGCCNIEWRAMHAICDAAIAHCCWACDRTRDQSKDCVVRRALETVPGVREAIKAAGNTLDCPFAGTGLDWGDEEGEEKAMH